MAETRLDVRPLPTWERHAKIFGLLDDLRGDDSLVVVTDHEPRPLRAELEAARTGQFVWIVRPLGETHWELTLRRVRDRVGDPPLVALLRRTIFVDAREDTLRAFAAAALERAIDAGGTLADQDAYWPYLGILVEGALLAVVGSRTGRDQVLFEVSPLETFAEVEALDGGQTIARIVATQQPARALLLPRDVVLACSAKDPDCARAVAAMCAQRTRIVVERLSATVARPTAARVAAALLPYATACEGLAPSLPALRRVTHGALAIAAGTVKEVVARAVGELEEAGAIRREAGRIALLDRAKLVAFIDAKE